MRALVCFALALTLWAVPLRANEHVDRLTTALHIEEVMEILSAEGLEQGRQLDKSLLEGQGGSYFLKQVEGLYDPSWMTDQVKRAFAEAMTETQMEQAAIFFESDLGQTIISLENSARRAFSDEAVEEVARAAYQQADKGAAEYRLIEEYIEVNDLIEQNTQNSLSSDYYFFRGVAAGQGNPVDENTLLAELLAQHDDTKAETRDWVFSFLLLAYKPLTQAQLRENIAFSRTDAGKALNLAIFEGFDEMYDTISYKLGQAVAQALRASDL